MWRKMTFIATVLRQGVLIRWVWAGSWNLHLLLGELTVGVLITVLISGPTEILRERNLSREVAGMVF